MFLGSPCTLNLSGSEDDTCNFCVLRTATSIHTLWKDGGNPTVQQECLVRAQSGFITSALINSPVTMQAACHAEAHGELAAHPFPKRLY